MALRLASSSSLALCAVAVAACGSDEPPSTPAACLASPDAFVAALATAPGEVAVGDTPIGDCLVAEQPAGELANVGEAMIAAATDLNEQAREQPLGEATVQLGYLVGTVEARAEATGGIHDDLARSVQSAATYVPGDELLPGGFQQRYEEGLAAGGGSG
ncbi:MAG: hypothetical protein ACR2G3_04215 [Solirubrobacterales bacterium]